MAVDMGSAVAYLLLDTTNFNTALNGAQNGLVAAGAKMASAGATMTATVTRGLVKLGQTAVTESANFESAMAQVRATMLKSTDEFNSEMGTVMLGAGENMREFTGNLTDFALEMASTTKFTATETAAALNYMALAGYNTQESMEMLPNVLNLAAAGAMDLALASDMVTDTQKAFGLSAERTKQLVDEMAKAASTGNTNVQQLGEAFLTIGGLARDLNGGFVTLADGTQASVDGIQELEVALTAMANAGIKSGEAGTHMRNVLLKLSSPTSDGTKQLHKLGVEVFDAQGKMKSLNTIFGDLSTSLGKLTQKEKLQAIGDLFNVRDTATIEALLNAVGQDWDKIGESILKSKDAAQEMADIQLDNLNGQITILKSGLQTVAIEFGNLMLPAIKKVVEWVQKLSKWLNSLDDAQKKTVMRFALIAAAIGPVLLVMGRLIALIGSARQGFALLGKGMTIGGSLGAAAIVGLVAAFAILYKRNEEFRKSVNNTFKNLKKSVETFTKSFKKSIDNLRAPIRRLLDRISTPFSTMIDRISGGFGKLIKNIGLSLETFSTKLGNFIDKVNFEKLFDVFGNISEFILNIASEGIPTLIDVFGTLLEAAEPVFNVILDIIDDISASLSEIDFESIFNEIKRFAESEEVKTFFESLATLINNCWDALQTLGEKFGTFDEDSTISLQDVIDKALELLSGVNDIINALNSLFDKDYPGAEKNLKSALEKLNGVLNWAFGSYNSTCSSITDLISDMFNSFIESAEQSESPFIRSLGKILSLVQTTFDAMESIIRGIIDVIKSVFGKDLGPDGQKLVNSLKNGLQSAWNSLVAWFNSLPVVNFAKKIIGGGGGFSGGGAGGSFATGLDYVPRTMNVTVHRGERILTQKENEEYSKGGSVEVVTYQNDEAINKLSATMDKLLEEVSNIKEMQIVLDGRKLVGGIVNEVDRQLGKKYERAGGIV